MLVGAGRVAENAETDEGRLLQEAGLRYGSALHIHRQGLREDGLDLCELIGRAYELVAAGNEAGMEGCALGVHAHSSLHELLFGAETGWQPLHLAWVAAGNDYIVIAGGGAYHHVHHRHAVGDTSGAPCRNDAVGVVALYERHRAHGGIDLAYAALHQHEAVVAQTAAVEGKLAVDLMPGVVEQSCQLLMLLCHC